MLYNSVFIFDDTLPSCMTLAVMHFLSDHQHIPCGSQLPVLPCAGLGQSHHHDSELLYLKASLILIKHGGG